MAKGMFAKRNADRERRIREMAEPMIDQARERHFTATKHFLDDSGKCRQLTPQEQEQLSAATDIFITDIRKARAWAMEQIGRAA